MGSGIAYEPNGPCSSLLRTLESSANRAAWSWKRFAALGYRALTEALATGREASQAPNGSCGWPVKPRHSVCRCEDGHAFTCFEGTCAYMPPLRAKPRNTTCLRRHSGCRHVWGWA